MRADVTKLLAEWRGGDGKARERLVSAVYEELRRIAAASLRNEAVGHTMQPTDLVHELYLRVFAAGAAEIADRQHLFAIAARQMRRILVDHARSRNAQKRGGGMLVALDAVAEPASKPRDLLAVDEALSKLAELDERAAQVVELRFFAGTTEQETADALAISVNTVKRDWDFARAWLYKALDPATSFNWRALIYEYPADHHGRSRGWRYGQGEVSLQVPDCILAIMKA